MGGREGRLKGRLLPLRSKVASAFDIKPIGNNAIASWVTERIIKRVAAKAGGLFPLAATVLAVTVFAEHLNGILSRGTLPPPLALPHHSDTVHTVDRKVRAIIVAVIARPCAHGT